MNWFGDEIRIDEIQNSYTKSTISVEFVYEFQGGRNSYRRIGFRIDEIRIDEFRYEIHGSQFVVELQIRIRIQRNGTPGADGSGCDRNDAWSLQIRLVL